MIEPAHDAHNEPTEAASPAAVYELDSSLLQAVTEALDAGDAERVRALVEPLHDADAADLLQNLDSEERRQLVRAIRGSFRPDILAELDDKVRDEIIEELGPAKTAAAVADMETDDALQVIADLDEEDQKLVLG